MSAHPACPRCATRLARETARGGDVAPPMMCPHGHGLFLAAAESERELDADVLRVLRRRVAAARVGEARCAGCGEPMRVLALKPRRDAGATWPIDLSRLEVDACASCHGIWFDAGELTKFPTTPGAFGPARPALGVARPSGFGAAWAAEAVVHVCVGILMAALDA